MDLRHPTFRQRAIGAVILGALACLVFAAPSSAGKEKVYYLDYNGQATEHPQDVFFTANSGPRVLDIGWRRWGSDKAVGRGTYYSNCNCPDDFQARAKLTLSDPVRCKPKFGTLEGKKIRVYKRGRMTLKRDGAEQRVDIPTGYDVCK